MNIVVNLSLAVSHIQLSKLVSGDFAVNLYLHLLQISVPKGY